MTVLVQGLAKKKPAGTKIDYEYALETLNSMTDEEFKETFK